VTSAHIFFIPGMIIIGMFFGFIFGARAARNQMDIQRKRDEEREIARAERAARRAQGGGKVDDRPPAEARGPEVTSERASSESKIDEKPAPSEDEPVAETKPKKSDGGPKSANKGGKGKRAS
jgi:hypothetical protein